MIAALLALLCAVLPVDRLEADVEAALVSRDSFCVSLRESAPPLVLADTDPISLGRIGVLLSNAEASRNPWFHLLRALYEIRSGSEKGEMFVDNALFIAKEDVGTLVGFSLELLRQGEPSLALRCAGSANAAFRSSGGVRSVYLEGLWEQAALRDSVHAKAWQSLASQVSRAALDGSSGEPSLFSWPRAVLAGTLAHGWRASVELFRQAWSLARAGAGWLLVLVILALAIRHLPATMHPLQELMGGLPVNMRRILSWLPLAGFLAAGWVVLGWVILFATVARWKSPAERWGGLLAGLFLALAPVDALIAGGFLDIDSRTGSLGTLVSALDGQEQAEDTLLAGAVSHARRGNTAQAIHGLKLSEAGSSKLGWYQDLRGWLFLQNGDLGAREILEDAWRQGRNPWTGLALGKTVDTTLELRRQLESGQGIGLPEPTPMQFAGLFVHSMGGVSAQAVWMPRGIVALPILGGIGVLLLAVLIALSMASMRNAGGIEPCVVCGHTTCPRCRKSALCARCQAKLAQAETADARRQMRLELVAHRVKVRRDFGIFADTVLPGWGGLVTSTGPAWGTLIILVVTCGVLGIGAHSILWTGDVEGAPVLALRLLGCLPAALWVGLVMPVRRVLTARRNG